MHLHDTQDGQASQVLSPAPCFWDHKALFCHGKMLAMYFESEDEEFGFYAFLTGHLNKECSIGGYHPTEQAAKDWCLEQVLRQIEVALP